MANALSLLVLPALDRSSSLCSDGAVSFYLKLVFDVKMIAWQCHRLRGKEVLSNITGASLKAILFFQWGTGEKNPDLPEASPSFPRLNQCPGSWIGSLLGLQDDWQHPDPSQVQAQGQGLQILNLRAQPPLWNMGLLTRTRSCFVYLVVCS